MCFTEHLGLAHTHYTRTLTVFVALMLALSCLGCNQEPEDAAKSPEATSQPAPATTSTAEVDATDQRALTIAGYPGLEFGTPLSSIDYSQMQHGSYAPGLYAYQRDELIEFDGGKIPATLMITAFANEPGMGNVEGVVLTYDISSIEWDKPEEPGRPAEFILAQRTKLLAAYATELIVENSDAADHAYLSLLDAVGNSVWLTFQQGTASRQHHLSLGYRSSALRAYRDQLAEQ